MKNESGTHIDIEVKWDESANVFIGKNRALPGIMSQGETREEAIAATRSAIAMYINVLAIRNQKLAIAPMLPSKLEQGQYIKWNGGNGTVVAVGYNGCEVKMSHDTWRTLLDCDAEKLAIHIL